MALDVLGRLGFVTCNICSSFTGNFSTSTSAAINVDCAQRNKSSSVGSNRAIRFFNSKSASSPTPKSRSAYDSKLAGCWSFNSQFRALGDVRLGVRRFHLNIARRRKRIRICSTVPCASNSDGSRVHGSWLGERYSLVGGWIDGDLCGQCRSPLFSGSRNVINPSSVCQSSLHQIMCNAHGKNLLGRFVGSNFVEKPWTWLSNSVVCKACRINGESLDGESRGVLGDRRGGATAIPRLNGVALKSARGTDGVERNVEVDVNGLKLVKGQVGAITDVESIDQKPWEVVTGYEQLVAFISKLVGRNRLIDHDPEQIWLLQEGDELQFEIPSGRRLLVGTGDLNLDGEPVGNFIRLDGLQMKTVLENLRKGVSFQRHRIEEVEVVGGSDGNAVSVKNVEVDVGDVHSKESQSSARTFVEPSSQETGEVLTAYERLVEFVSHLVTRDKIISLNTQGKWLLQGLQSSLYWHIQDPADLDNNPQSIVCEDSQVNFGANRVQVDSHIDKVHSVQSRPVQLSIDSRTEYKSHPIYSRTLSEARGKRLRVAGLQRDFKILEKELFTFISDHGRQGIMPMRSELRQHRRVDLEKAIARMGGFSNIAVRLDLCQQRRPRGYWDNFQNLRQQILVFQVECGMDRSFMPTRNSLIKGGRPDVARALEKWGGVQQVAQLMGLNVRRVRPKPSSKLEPMNTLNVKVEDVLPQKPLKISLPAKPRKWVDMKQAMRSTDQGNN